jgi:hypothetical protein
MAVGLLSRQGVVTAPAEGTARFVVAAYFTRNIKQGTVLWKK